MLSCEDPSGLSVMSWNVYFDDDSGRERYPKIIQHLLEQDSDVICLQEVTPSFIEHIIQAQRLGDYQLIVDPARRSYKNAILTRWPVYSFKSIPLPGRMGRKGLLANLNVKGQPLSIVALHLESGLNDGKIRKNQFDQIVKSFDSHTDSLLCGDMNFGDVENDDEALKRAFIDIGLSDKQFTYDIETNALARQTRFWNEDSRRLDRIYLKQGMRFEQYQVDQSPWSDHYPISARVYFSADCKRP